MMPFLPTLSPRLMEPLFWQAGPGPESPYQLQRDGQDWQIRLGDFPAEALYGLWIDGKLVLQFDAWPENWRKPAPG